MKVAIVFVLLFATVLCRPVTKPSDASSESSEEVRRPAAPTYRKQVVAVPLNRKAPAKNVVAAAAAGSEESSEASNNEEQVAAEAQVDVNSDVTDSTASTDTASVNSNSEDSDEDDDDDETEENETEEDDDDDESSNSSESGESSTPAPTTETAVVVTEEPAAETTAEPIEPIEPTIVTDTDTARGDNFGGYPSDYKSIVFVEDKSYHKIPVPYKSYEYIGKSTGYDMKYGNEVEKSQQMYKSQVPSDVLEEDTSTPEVESQGLDTTSSSQDASLPEEASNSDATTSESESSSNPDEEESSSAASESASAEDEDSQSSEEATATPGAADSDSDENDSDESDSDEQGASDTTTDMPMVITAK